jgi:alcohol dehydrogenase class IV
MVDMFCLDGIRRAARALPRAYDNGRDAEARADMSMASLLGGLSLANAGLGAVHGFAAPIGGMFPAPHGAVCAALLPWVMDANIRALRARAPESEALRRYETIAGIVGNRPGARPELAVEWAAELCERLDIPPLRAYGIGEQHFPALVERAQKASSMKGNPIPLTVEELTAILARAV